MNNFVVTFQFQSILFSCNVKKKKHESTTIYAVDLEQEFLQRILNSRKLVLIEQVSITADSNFMVTLSQSVRYFPDQKADSAFEKIIWNAINQSNNKIYKVANKSTQAVLEFA
jgi:hypothetical protein